MNRMMFGEKEMSEMQMMKAKCEVMYYCGGVRKNAN